MTFRYVDHQAVCLSCGSAGCDVDVARLRYQIACGQPYNELGSKDAYVEWQQAIDRCHQRGRANNRGVL